MGYAIHSAGHLVGMWRFAHIAGVVLSPTCRYANAGAHGCSNCHAASHRHADPFGNGNGDGRAISNASAYPVPHAAAHPTTAGLGPARGTARGHALVALGSRSGKPVHGRFRRPADLHRHVRRTGLGTDWHTPLERTGATAAGHSRPQSRRKLAGGPGHDTGHVN